MMMKILCVRVPRNLAIGRRGNLAPLNICQASCCWCCLGLVWGAKRQLVGIWQCAFELEIQRPGMHEFGDQPPQSWHVSQQSGCFGLEQHSSTLHSFVLVFIYIFSSSARSNSLKRVFLLIFPIAFFGSDFTTSSARGSL